MTPRQLPQERPDGGRRGHVGGNRPGGFPVGIISQHRLDGPAEALLGGGDLIGRFGQQ